MKEKKKVIAILGTLDTKEAEAFYLKERIELEGCGALIIDVSTSISHPTLGKPDIKQTEVAKAAGFTIEEVFKMSRGAAAEAMSKGVTNIIKKLYKERKIDGVIGYGGSSGMSIISPALKELPIGFPKYIVTTGITGASTYIGIKDIIINPSITDLAGGKVINQVEAKILANAAGAICGMAKVQPPAVVKRPTIFVTQMGVTTPCTLKCKELLTEKGYDVIAFHAIGTGGDALEALVDAGMSAGVLDITLAELSNMVAGGSIAVGSNRLTTAGKKGIPQVIVPGAMDMANFRGPGTSNIPEKFKEREFYIHNPMVTLMRINETESRELGKIIASKLNAAKGPTALVIPMKGWSAYDADGFETVDYNLKPTGKTWCKPEVNQAFVDELERNLDLIKPNIDLVKVDMHINDPEFATLLVNIIDAMVKGIWKKGKMNYNRSSNLIQKQT